MRRYLLALKQVGLPVTFGLIFGSQATGGAGEWSDIDVLVVSPRFDQNYGYEDVAQLWRVAAATDSRIEPVACGLEEWRTGDRRAIVEAARRAGERIELTEASA